MPSDTFGADPLEIKEQLGRIAMQPSVQAQHEAQARFLMSRAKVSEQRARLDQEMSEELKRMSAGGMGDESNPLWNIARAAGKVGHPDTPRIAVNAERIDYMKTGQERQRAQIQLIQRRTQINNLSLMDHELSGVNSPESFREAIMRVEEQTGQPSPWLDQRGNLKIQWTPTLNEQIRRKAMSKKDELTLAQRKAANDATAAEYRSRDSHRKFYEDADRQRAISAARAQGRQQKVTGDPLVPAPKVTRAGADYIKFRFPDQIIDTEARVKGDQLMEMAKSMIEKNPAISSEEAKEEALKVMISRGDFVGKKLDKRPSGGKTPATATPVPPKVEDRVVGHYYTGTGGAVGKWTGAGWEVTPPDDDDDAAATADDAEADRMALEDDEE